MQEQQLVRGRPAREAEELREIPHGGPRLRRAGAGAAHARLAGGRAHEPAADLHQRGLAGPVRPEQPDELAFLDVEVDPAERRHRPVALHEPARRERRRHRRESTLRSPDGSPRTSCAESGGVAEYATMQSADKALAILAAFDEGRPDLGVSELAAELGMHKSTVSRLLAALERRGLVRREGERFAPGPELARLGALAVRGLTLVGRRAAAARAPGGADGRDRQPRRARGRPGAERPPGRRRALRRRHRLDGPRGPAARDARTGRRCSPSATARLPGELARLTPRTIVDRGELRAELERDAQRRLRGRGRGARARAPRRRRAGLRRRRRLRRGRLGLRARLPAAPSRGCPRSASSAPPPPPTSRPGSAFGGRPDGLGARVLPGRADGRASRSSTASTSTSSAGASRFGSRTCSTPSSRACGRTGAPAFPTEGKAGEGRTNRLDGVVVLSCLDFPAEERPLHEQESVDRPRRPGRRADALRAGTNVVLTFDARADARERGARGLGARARRSPSPRSSPRPTLERRARRRRALRARARPTRACRRSPRSCSSPTSGRSTTSTSTAFRSGSAGLPRAVDPAELLDGAVTCGEYHWAALRNPTIFFQRNALVRALYREHGRRLRFAGVVLMRGYEQTADDKQRAASAAARGGPRARRRRRRRSRPTPAATRTPTSMLTVPRLRGGRRPDDGDRRRDGRPGRRRARASPTGCRRPTRIVSAGNAEELVPAWTPERVLGGDTLLDGTAGGRRRADPGAELPRRRRTRWASTRSRRRHGEGGPLPEPVLRRPRRRGGGRDAADPARRRGRPRPRPGRRARGDRDRRDARLRRRLLRRARGARRSRELLELLEAEEPGAARRGPGVRLRPLRLRLCAFFARRRRAARHPGARRDARGEPGRRRRRGQVLDRCRPAVNVAGMREALPRMARLAEALVSGPRARAARRGGLRPARLPPKPARREAGRRARHRPPAGEARGRDPNARWPAASTACRRRRPVADLSQALVALVTEAGCVPQGNPDRLPTIRAQGWLRYALGGAPTLASGPVRVGARRLRRHARQRGSRTGSSRSTRSRALEEEGRIGRLHDVFYTTTGNGTPVAAATRFGREIAAELTRSGRRRRPPLGHLRDGHALRVSAGEGDRAGGHADGVRDVASDDRDDGRRQPDRARPGDHAPVRARRGRAAADRRAGARDARDRRRADDGVGGRPA